MSYRNLLPAVSANGGVFQGLAYNSRGVVVVYGPKRASYHDAIRALKHAIDRQWRAGRLEEVTV